MSEKKSFSQWSNWRQIFIVLWRWLVLSQFAIWMGGFTFYAAYVVPIGNEVLGSAREQGFVTQQVTNWLNVVCAISIFFMLADDLLHVFVKNRSKTFGSSTKSSIAKILAILCTISVLALLIWLVILHQKMDGMLDASQKSVSDKSEFYLRHRWYLWISTFQWVIAWVWLAFFVRRNLYPGNPDVDSHF